MNRFASAATALGRTWRNAKVYSRLTVSSDFVDEEVKAELKDTCFKKNAAADLMLPIGAARKTSSAQRTDWRSVVGEPGGFGSLFTVGRQDREHQ